jgi:hypothetical protein
MTRRRHRLPPQPREWFQNLARFLGDALKIRIARKDGCPVAAMLTVRFKDTLVYKYGCADERYNNFGGVPMLFWTAIQEAHAAGLQVFDFGRTDAGQSGLITFKNRWGACQSPLNYLRFAPAGKSTHMFDLPTSRWKTIATKELLSHFPGPLLPILGRVLYKHIG